MQRLIVLLLCGAMTLCVGARSAPRIASAAGCRTVGAHHLRLDATTAVYSFGVRGGFSAGGSWNVTIYGNGVLKLKKPVSGKLRLQKPKLVIYPTALHGMLKLAEAEGFFCMPASRVGPHPNPDASATIITITTTSGTKRVKIRSIRVAGFDELFGVLTYVTGATF